MGRLDVHVLHTGLHAGQVLVIGSKYPPSDQALKHLKVAQSSKFELKKVQHSKHLSAEISQSLQRVEQSWQDFKVVST